MFDQDKFHDECGIFGVYGCPEAANLTYLGLYALQHRGQESAGIVSTSNGEFYAEVAMGLVADIFNEKKLRALKGNISIGHNRYSTTGSSLLKNAQPFIMHHSKGTLAVAHNGNLVNVQKLKEGIEKKGAIFISTSDTEIICHLIAMSQEKKLEDRVAWALQQVKGAYSIIVMSEDEIIGVRDPNGFRPLVLGKHGDGYILASETCALDLIEATFLREIQPGEMVVINGDSLKSYFPFAKVNPSFCIFEFIYFARPDSNIFGHNVYEIRRQLGVELAHESPVEADIVIPVPDSGVPAALGFAEASNIPFEMGLIRNHYIGRTFIEPQNAIRNFGVKIKLNPVRKFIQGKRVVIIDDSIVRGTTCRKIIAMIRQCGAKEVHLRISSPPTQFPCFYGIDTPTQKELIASEKTINRINNYLNSDSLAYLSLDGLLKCVNPHSDKFCTACFSGIYPIEIQKEDNSQLSLF